MSLQKLDLKSLAEIDNGRVGEALMQALRRCDLDCRDRPGVKAARTVTFKINLVPVPDPEGALDSVDVSFDINDKLPKRASKSYNMTPARGGLLFNELSPADADQMTFELGPKEASAGAQ